MNTTGRDKRRQLAAAAARRSRGALGRFKIATARAIATIPPEARRELRGSLWRLRKVRSPRSAAAAFEAEIDTLLRVVTPMLVDHPLPVRRTRIARGVVAGGAAMAATAEQLEAVVALFSEGVAVPGTLPIALGAMFLSLALELHVALSLRVHDLRSAGAVVDPQRVSAEVAWAMAGAGGRPGRSGYTRAMVRKLSTRMLWRWGRGLIPVAGAAYSAWDAQRTVAAIARLGVVPQALTNPVKGALPAAE